MTRQTSTRRRLLEAVGASAVLLSSVGCLAPASDDGRGTSPGDATRTTTDRSSATDTSTITASPPPRDRFEGALCPSFTDVEPTVCWHAREDDAVAIEPSQPVFRPVGGNDAVETITFTLRNTRNAPITFNPYSWAVKRKTGDGWSHIAPESVPYEPLYELDPGTAYRWVLSRRTHPTPKADRTTYPTVPVENGRHAFVLTGQLLDAPPYTTATTQTTASPSATAATTDTAVEWVTLFDVQRVYR
ncbi:MAG: hypothetical protein ABEK02_02695 [Haloquadratum sp.]